MTPRFFGYGSLVNLSTHDYPDAQPARLSGWRRVWRHATLRPVAFLSVEPAPESEIDGVLAQVPGADWAALDLRERAYRRQDVTHHFPQDGAITPTAVYEIEASNLEPPDVAHPILLSYVDVVLQGYLQLFGEAGMRDFARTTRGWHAPVLDDRARPVYPRHRQLSGQETRLVDRLLADLGAEISGPDAFDLSGLVRS
ncbi:gamma-glutamylcyclotransferase family protein [Roseisalinus antarcticus]|uniref:Gamma-glutamylcyclotransferase AIG2-like domain-containing protein n=1 Tax=Roseisalinus antarcticus TaxID=254357 RepID=A0A1Y5S161_9RHOB|nr:gamma-glutamylcyclotransferase family protein [Roseisalinus antarcticus]SLN27294.1 hypothetical protein ROA7023_00873 [Roseisalinus antarcticus]